MKILFLTVVILILFIATNGYSHPTPSWIPAHIKEIKLLKHAKEVRVIKDIQDINTIAQCLGRADTIRKVTFWSFVFGSGGNKENNHNYNFAIDVLGEKPESGRWMYDSEHVSYLDPFIQSVYRLKEMDREVINRIFKIDTPLPEEK